MISLYSFALKAAKLIGDINIQGNSQTTEILEYDYDYQEEYSKIDCYFKFSSGYLKANLTGIDLSEIEYFVLKSIMDGYSLDDLAYIISFDKNKISKYFNYMVGKYIDENFNITPFGMEIFTINKIVKYINSNERFILVDKYNLKPHNKIILKVDNLKAFKSTIEKNSKTILIEEKIYDYKLTKILNNNILKDNDIKIKLLMQSYEELNDYNKIISKYINSIDLTFYTRRDTYLNTIIDVVDLDELQYQLGEESTQINHIQVYCDNKILYNEITTPGKEYNKISHKNSVKPAILDKPCNEYGYSDFSINKDVYYIAISKQSFIDLFYDIIIEANGVLI